MEKGPHRAKLKFDQTANRLIVYELRWRARPYGTVGPSTGLGTTLSVSKGRTLLVRKEPQ